MKIEKFQYTGPVYNIEVEPNHPSEDDQFYVNASTGLVVHNCHPRDNIALRWLSQEYNLGYDLFDTVMLAREQQARNLAEFLIDLSKKHNLPIVIHGKAYKPDVPYCNGSYSTLIASYIKSQGHTITFVDPLADDMQDVVKDVVDPAVILLAHNRNITYGYTDLVGSDINYFEFQPGSVIVDPWRKYPNTPNMTVIHYGNTRK
jgi:UDPglucose 6-dehydrogenase